MKKLFVALIFSSSVTISGDYADVFDRSIFEQDDLPSDASHEIIITGLNRRKLDKLFRNNKFTELEIKISELEKRSGRLNISYKGTALSLITIPVGLLNPLAGFATMLYVMYYSFDDIDRINKDKAQAYRMLRENKKKRLMLINNLFFDPIYDLERDYIKRKSVIREDIQTKIEEEILASYKDGLKQEILLRDLIFFPTDTIIYPQTDNDGFIRAREENGALLKSLLERRHLQVKDIETSLEIFALLADAGAMRARVCRYICAKDVDAVNHTCTTIAKRLERPYLVVKPAGELDKESTHGTSARRGLFLEPFFMTNIHGNRYLNPIMIIINADQWLKNPKSALALKDLVDESTEQTSFHSNYFGIDMDFREMSVICIGSSKKDCFEDYIQSRLQSYLWSDSIPQSQSAWRCMLY